MARAGAQRGGRLPSKASFQMLGTHVCQDGLIAAVNEATSCCLCSLLLTSPGETPSGPHFPACTSTWINPREARWITKSSVRLSSSAPPRGNWNARAQRMPGAHWRFAVSFSVSEPARLDEWHQEEEDRQTVIVAQTRPGWHPAPAELERQSTQVASRGVGGGAVREA